MRDVLSRQVANTLVSAKTTGGGSFIFMIDEQAKPVDYLTIETQSVLIEVSSVGADYVEAFEVLGRANTVLLRNHDYESLPRHTIPMGRDEFHVLSLVNDERTVLDVKDMSHLEEVTVISVLGKFCEAGVLHAKAEKAAEDHPTPSSRRTATASGPRSRRCSTTSRISTTVADRRRRLNGDRGLRPPHRPPSPSTTVASPISTGAGSSRRAPSFPAPSRRRRPRDTSGTLEGRDTRDARRGRGCESTPAPFALG